MDRELEVIQDDMEQTRANLADKLGALETQVRETVSGASETVSSAVEGVKEVVGSVSDTVSSVTETFNISKQVEQHPWVALGVAVGAGFVAAQLFGGSSTHHYHAAPPAAGAPPAPHPEGRPHAAHQPPAPAPAPEQPSLVSQAASMLPDMSKLVPDLDRLLPDVNKLLPDVNGVLNTAISGVSGLAIGSLMNVVRGLAADAIPQEWKNEVDKLIDDVTRQLGGKRVEMPHKEELQKHAGGGDGAAPAQGQHQHGTEPAERNRGRRTPAAV